MPRSEGRGFEHHAILHTGAGDFVAQATPLVRGALEEQRASLVALTPTTLAGLRESLGPDAQHVRWMDITGIGRNPARIIPLWREFVEHERREGGGRPVFGIGEPVHAERTPAEMVEAERHEALLNLAFRDTADFDLYCPYDMGRLDVAVIEAAAQTHPQICRGDTAGASPSYRAQDLTKVFSPPLPAGRPAAEMSLESTPASEVHHFVLSHAPRPAGNGTGGTPLSDLAMATVAVAAAVGGRHLRTWSEDGRVLVEVSGRVPITDPLAGREWPPPSGEPAHGLWLANQLCDLVQWRSGEDGLVRLLLS